MGKQKGEQVACSDCRRPTPPANKSPIFYRMIVPSIIQDKKLRIPGKFVTKLGNELADVATLTTPNGCNWQVRVKKIENKVWFTDGWHEFVQHQSIRVGYFLFFAYEGNSNFSVNIYDLGTAEIKYKWNSSSKGPSCKDKAEDEDSVEILDSLPRCNSNKTEVKKSHFKANGGNLHAYSVWSAPRSTRDIGIQCGYNELMTSEYEARLHSLNQRPEKHRKRKRDECETSAKEGSEVPTPGTEKRSGSFLSKLRVVTPEEKERVLNESKTFQSENPFCRVFLRRSYVYKGIGLHMPSSFAEKYLGGVSGFITLQVSSGKKWPVRCMWSNGSAKLSKGWPEFVRDNMLDVGDVCVFELIKTVEVVLKVAIFRAVEDAEPVNQLSKELHIQTHQLASVYDLNG